jgi:peptidoglycan/xylan/chitin deacetylase (PgdA/CDA1 family)
VDAGYWLKLWMVDAVSICGRLLTPRPAPGIRILVYHDIRDVAPAEDPLRITVPPMLFERQIRHLHETGARFLSLEDSARALAGGDVPDRAVAITFDDGYHSFLTEALPILRRYGVPATLFVAVGYVGGAGFPFSAGTLVSRPLNWLELQRIAATPGIWIGSHTTTHRFLHRLAPAERFDELARSRDILQTRLGQPVRALAYPFGGWGAFPIDVQEAVEAAGYTTACTNVMGTNRRGANLLALRRVRVGWEDGRWRFKLKVAGGYDWGDGVRHLLARRSTAPGAARKRR